jgi:hypothetical protein
MSKDNSNTSEEYLNRSLSRAQSSFKTWIIAAVTILILESGYFYFIHSKIADGVSFLPGLFADYEEQFNSIKETASKFPKKSEYADQLKMFEDVLDKITMAKENHASEMAKFEDVLDKINAAHDPEGVADLISAELVKEIKFQGYKISTFGRDYFAEEMKRAPRWASEQIPKYGARLRHDVNNWIHQFCSATSDGLGETFDAFLDKHADEIRKFSEATDDQATLDKLDEEFIEEIAIFMDTTPIENFGTLKQQADQFLKRIEAANELLKPLVRKKTSELTKEELRLRHAVGLFMHLVKNPPAKLKQD